MKDQKIREMLEQVKNETLTIEEAMFELKKLPFEDLGYAKVDHHRELRNGYPEVIFGQGKTVEQIKTIFESLLEKNKNVMVTRATREIFEGVQDVAEDAIFNEMARIVYVQREPVPRDAAKYIAVVSAGTSDMPVAEEAALTAEILGNTVRRIYDVGVAGIHRLLANTDELMQANVLIVVAGMEGALASVVGGLVDKPVVAVPTSVGYGASFGGISALLTMLNSCASGIGVVNIDNGFGAGYLAATINRSD